MLDELGDWTTPAALVERLAGRGRRSVVMGYLCRLIELGLVERRPGAARWPWAPWSPEAAFFHFGTRARAYADDPRAQDVALRRKALHDPPPAPAKRVRGSALALPPPQHLGGLTEHLLARRTWRNFSKHPVSIEDLATVLQLTWGVQHRANVRKQGPVVLKTSPSAGARHPVEAYLLASKVKGLKPGAYHYAALTHRLVSLARPISPARLERLLANQDYYRNAAAVVVMTAVVARSMWKYPSSRAYRAILLDAGHLGQTFCLVATALGLAPFSTMAFVEDEIEPIVRVDGLTECVVYIVGLGTRDSHAAVRPGRISARRP